MQCSVVHGHPYGTDDPGHGLAGLRYTTPAGGHCVRITPFPSRGAGARGSHESAEARGRSGALPRWGEAVGRRCDRLWAQPPVGDAGVLTGG